MTRLNAFLFILPHPGQTPFWCVGGCQEEEVPIAFPSLWSTRCPSSNTPCNIKVAPILFDRESEYRASAASLVSPCIGTLFIVLRLSLTCTSEASFTRLTRDFRLRSTRIFTVQVHRMFSNLNYKSVTSYLHSPWF